MVAQHRQIGVVDRGEYVVKKQAHAHATIGRSHQPGGKHGSRVVGFHQEILGIDADFGTVHQRKTRSKRVEALGQWIETVYVRSAAEPLAYAPRCSGLRNIFGCERGYFRSIQRYAGASDNQQHKNRRRKA